MKDSTKTRTDFLALGALISLLAGSFTLPYLGRRGSAHREAGS